MARVLDGPALYGAASYYAGLFTIDSGRFNRDWVMGQIHNFTFKDEFDYIVDRIREQLGGKPRDEFDTRIGKLLKDKPRSDDDFEVLLRAKLAVDRDGNHVDGLIGTTQIGARLIGFHDVEVETPESLRLRRLHGLGKDHRRTWMKRVRLYWPIYAGEGEERAAGSGVADPLPDGTPPLPVGAEVSNFSAESCIAGLDALLDLLDEGTGAAVIQGRTGAQPADPDAVVTGTLLFTCVCTDPAFAAAADQTDGTVQAAASAISDDASADATGTLGYCRASATNDGATPLDDHIDGNAATSAAAFVFNTLSIVSGATVSISSWTVTQSQGSTAT